MLLLGSLAASFQVAVLIIIYCSWYCRYHLKLNVMHEHGCFVLQLRTHVPLPRRNTRFRHVEALLQFDLKPPQAAPLDMSNMVPILMLGAVWLMLQVAVITRMVAKYICAVYIIHTSQIYCYFWQALGPV